MLPSLGCVRKDQSDVRKSTTAVTTTATATAGATTTATAGATTTATAGATAGAHLANTTPLQIGPEMEVGSRFLTPLLSPLLSPVHSSSIKAPGTRYRGEVLTCEGSTPGE